MSDRILPSLLILSVKREQVHNKLIYFAESAHFVRRLLNSHCNQRNVGVGRFGVGVAPSVGLVPGPVNGLGSVITLHSHRGHGSSHPIHRHATHGTHTIHGGHWIHWIHTCVHAAGMHSHPGGHSEVGHSRWGHGASHATHAGWGVVIGHSHGLHTHAHAADWVHARDGCHGISRGTVCVVGSFGG